jgi:16S rRNA C1402 (ribose-2'-O) methylase RsmI
MDRSSFVARLRYDVSVHRTIASIEELYNKTFVDERQRVARELTKKREQLLNEVEFLDSCLRLMGLHPPSSK